MWCLLAALQSGGCSCKCVVELTPCLRYLSFEKLCSTLFAQAFLS